MECGWPGYLVLLLGAIATMLGLVTVGLGLARARAGVVVGILAVVAALAPPAAGVLGSLLGRAKVDSILPMVDPSQREHIRTAGYEEAGQCTNIGLGCGAAPLLLSLAGLGLVLARRRPAAT